MIRVILACYNLKVKRKIIINCHKSVVVMMEVMIKDADVMIMEAMMIMTVAVIKKRIIAQLILAIKLLIYYMELIKMYRS